MVLECNISMSIYGIRKKHVGVMSVLLYVHDIVLISDYIDPKCTE